MPAVPEATRQHWDAIIIGTGMGGATLGYALAQAGWRVLFCEKGQSTLQDGNALRGGYAEAHFPRPAPPGPEHASVLQSAGRWAEPIVDLSGERPSRFIPFIGSGTGGSTGLFGMVLERFLPADFTPRRYHHQAIDSTIPEQWPISYDQLVPYYTQAEALYSVAGIQNARQGEPGTPNPALPHLSAASRELFDHFAGKGLHPYRLPLACSFAAGCLGCQGYLCAIRCKHDSALTCVAPAMQKYGAKLLTDCEVLRLESDGKSVTKAICRRNGAEIELRGRVFVLAAGALNTPALLLRSTSTRWPAGLANESGLVGRNLMRHYVDLYAIHVGDRAKLCGNLKELGCNDFYLFEGSKLGAIQSFGPMPPTTAMVEGLLQDLRDGGASWLASCLGPAKPVLRKYLGRVFSRSLVMATIAEDLPYLDNHVSLPSQDEAARGARIAIKYTVRPYDRDRIERFRQLVTQALHPCKFMLLKQAENNQRIAHVCGTCRFGANPRDSVLDKYNRAHSLENAYVVDASFFPSSGGTNPALTIAANALRVASHLTEKYR